MLIVDDAPDDIALIAERLKSYSLIFHTLPSPVRVMPLFKTAGFAPMPNDIVSDDKFTMIRPLRLALAATACADAPVTVALVGAEPVKGVFVLTVPLIVADEPIPGFWDIALLYCQLKTFN